MVSGHQRPYRMDMKYRWMISGALCVLLAGLLPACEKVQTATEQLPAVQEESAYVSLEEVARLLSSLPLQTAQLEEVHDAVSASAGNGYDEEYRMVELFAAPGAGVGDSLSTKAGLYTRTDRTGCCPCSTPASRAPFPPRGT